MKTLMTINDAAEQSASALVFDPNLDFEDNVLANLKRVNCPHDIKFQKLVINHASREEWEAAGGGENMYYDIKAIAERTAELCLMRD